MTRSVAVLWVTAMLLREVSSSLGGCSARGTCEGVRTIGRKGVLVAELLIGIMVAIGH